MIIKMTYPKRALELFSATCDYGDPFGCVQLLSSNIRRVQLVQIRAAAMAAAFLLSIRNQSRTGKSKTKSPRG